MNIIIVSHDSIIEALFPLILNRFLQGRPIYNLLVTYPLQKIPSLRIPGSLHVIKYVKQIIFNRENYLFRATLDVVRYKKVLKLTNGFAKIFARQCQDHPQTSSDKGVSITSLPI